MNEFIIVAPAYSARSGGIMVLHELCTALNLLKYRAGLILITEGSQKNQDFKFGYSNLPELQDPNGIYYDFTTGKTETEIHEFINNSCIIYPDIIKGNPLNSQKFATYVLGKPLYPIESDFIISFSKIYIEQSDFILFKPFISEWMHARETMHWSERKLCLTYIGKGYQYAQCELIPGSVLIERDWPKDKRQLAELLRNCKYFFSWDSISATNTDAILCGAVPVLMQDKQIPRGEIDLTELGPLPHVNYFQGMEHIKHPNQDQIDAEMTAHQNAASEYLSTWLNRVSALAKVIVGTTSPKI
jgi:hypothetical protein